jgi:hypothetical protein
MKAGSLPAAGEQAQQKSIYRSDYIDPKYLLARMILAT